MRLENAVGSVFGPDNSAQRIDLYPFGALFNQVGAYDGPDSFVYVVKDATVNQTRSTVSLHIATHLPVAEDDSFVLSRSSGATSLLIPIAGILANDSDIDLGQVLSLAGFAGPNQVGEGTLACNPADQFGAKELEQIGFGLSDVSIDTTLPSLGAFIRDNGSLAFL